MKKSVFCIAATEVQAQAITTSLGDNGFSKDDISVLFLPKRAIDSVI